MKTTTCPDCGVAVIKSGRHLLNVGNDATHLRHDLSCTAREKKPMSNDVFDSISDEEKVQRDRWGRPLIKPLGGGKPVGFTRCTTFVSCLEDTFNLSRWQQRMVALGLASRPDLLLSVSAHSDDKDMLNKVCDEAREAAAASAAATTGTALHRIAERLDSGEQIPVPAAAAADIAAYQAATAAFSWVSIEKMRVNDELKVAGTPDRTAHIPGVELPVVTDMKTGSIDFGIGKIAMQLAVYAHSDRYDVASGERISEALDQERALIVHLPAGQGVCNLVWVDIAAGWEAVQLAREVHAWRKRKGLTTPYKSATASPTVADVLGSLIAAAKDADALAALWRQHKADWTPAHSELARQRKAALTTGAAA